MCLTINGKQNNSVLHIAATLKGIPLSLSLIYNQMKNCLAKLNKRGNTPLTEALLNDCAENALFLL